MQIPSLLLYGVFSSSPPLMECILHPFSSFVPWCLWCNYLYFLSNFIIFPPSIECILYPSQNPYLVLLAHPSSPQWNLSFIILRVKPQCHLDLIFILRNNHCSLSSLKSSTLMLLAHSPLPYGCLAFFFPHSLEKLLLLSLTPQCPLWHVLPSKSLLFS